MSDHADTIIQKQYRKGFLSMREYVRPMMMSEAFAPNEYISACVVGTIECAIPGRDPYTCDGSSPTRYFNYNMSQFEWGWGEPTIGRDRLEHGICGNSAPISFNGSTGSGYETIGGEIQRNRPIYNISGYDLEPGIYKVTWNSDSGGPMYNHYGELHISYIDYDHPNHS